LKRYHADEQKMREGMRKKHLPKVAGVYRKSGGSCTYAVLPRWSVCEDGRICDEQGREPQIRETPLGFLHARLPMTRNDYPPGAQTICSIPVDWAVCAAFHGEKEGSAPFSGPRKWVPMHKNGVVSDNRAENLYWERVDDSE
jgi:hypothetical protein